MAVLESEKEINKGDKNKGSGGREQQMRERRRSRRKDRGGGGGVEGDRKKDGNITRKA